MNMSVSRTVTMAMPGMHTTDKYGSASYDKPISHERWQAEGPALMGAADCWIRGMIDDSCLVLTHHNHLQQ